MPPPPWSRTTGVEAVLDKWLASGAVEECLAADRLIPPTEASFAAVPAGVALPLRAALEARGIRELYSHQAVAVRAALSGRHVVVATPTASGKSLCFHLPVLTALAAEPQASALYVYPTKALSRDQEHSLRSLISDSTITAPAMVYDGDTPGDARRAARESCRVVLTNPDMLHASILPNHVRWASTLSSLRYVVLDELHTYRGVFGSHMAHVLARLRRVARFHGTDPVFLAATATIGNPRDHAARLLQVPESAIELVNRSGAPQAARRLFVYNPPLAHAQLGVRESALKHAVRMTAELVRARVPTLVFAQSRNSVEVMLKYLRQECSGDIAPEAIMGYRGGYLPATRRSIEQGLREGRITCVIATNALELGIDIGDLDAVVCVGYPGSIAGTWQRFGRAGRRGKTSIALLVCGGTSLDQFLAREPEYLLRAGAEEARIDPSNVEIVIQHLKCAVFEAPFDERPSPPESYAVLDATETRQALDYLATHGVVHESAGRYHWASEAFPATHVSLRNIGWDNFVIVDVETGRSLAELDWRSAHTMLHEQAIYQHDAEQYQVERLDYENHKAFVRKVTADYFTTALTYRSVEAIEQMQSRRLGRATIGWGEVKVIEKVTGYKKVKFFTHENAGYGDVHLPEVEMHTTAFWLTVGEVTLAELEVPRAAAIDALRAFGAALETVGTLALMCEPSDIGRTLGDGDGHGAEGSPRGTALRGLPGRNPFEGRVGRLDPTLFLFDAVPGGVGLASRIYERASELLEAAERLVSRCPCAAGCPACIGPADRAGRKELALGLLRRLSNARKPPVGQSARSAAPANDPINGPSAGTEAVRAPPS